MESQEEANDILAIAEPKKGQELLERAKSGKLVELAEDQTIMGLARFHYYEQSGKAQVDEYHGWTDAILDMREDGFRRVKVKG